MHGGLLEGESFVVKAVCPVEPIRPPLSATTSIVFEGRIEEIYRLGVVRPSTDTDDHSDSEKQTDHVSGDLSNRLFSKDSADNSSTRQQSLCKLACRLILEGVRLTDLGRGCTPNTREQRTQVPRGRPLQNKLYS